MAVIDRAHINGFVQAIWEWYAVHKRTLPWRDMQIENDTERAYRVLVSEVMLQQTQVSRVKIVFNNFLEIFPTIKDLAAAPNSDVIMAWRGMGYNSRALRLRDAAKSVIDIYGGTFPRDEDELLAIKGLGPYTAAAVRNFAFNIATPCIDTNIRRILHRTFVGPEESDGTWAVGDKELLKIAEEVLQVACHPSRHRHVMVRSESERSDDEPRTIGGAPQDDVLHDARNWHAALMDYGSLVQTKNNPKWDICILTDRKLMKATPENWKPPVRGAAKERLKKEPGRLVGSTYIPNRIFRGKIVEALRDAEKPMSSEEIGKQICIDWEAQHREWLMSLLIKLETDQLIAKRSDKYLLA